MVTARQLTPTQMKLIEAKKERDRRMQEAVRRRELQESAEIIPFLSKRELPKVQIPNQYRDLIKRRCEEFGLPIADIIGDCRITEICLLRQIIWYEMKFVLPGTISYPGIGKYFPGKDHSSIISGVKKIEKMGLENALSLLSGTIAKERELVAMGVEKKAPPMTRETYWAIRAMLPHKKNREIARYFNLHMDRIQDIRAGRKTEPAK